MNIIKGALHILIINQCFPPPQSSTTAVCRGLSWRQRRTSAGPGRGVKVVLMGAAVILAFSEQQHLGRVAACRTNLGRVARQALAVTC